MLYEALKPLVRVALAWYYRSIAVSGAERVPASGPVFLAVNHPNALVDALVVAAFVPRRVRFTAKATIFANPLAAAFFTRMGVVPLRRAADENGAQAASLLDPSRNAASFDAVADALAEEAAIVIFPEGKSHDAPQLAPLRSGLARMVQMAGRERGVRGIRIVPVGLLFERKEEPRTRVLVQVGEPIDVDAFAATFPDGEVPVPVLTAAVAQRLAAVTSNFDTPEDAERIGLIGETLAALLEPVRALGDDVVPLSATLGVVRRIDRAQRVLRSPEHVAEHPGLLGRIAAFESRLRAFRARLHGAHVAVHDVAISAATGSGAQFVVRELFIALALLPFVLWGRLTHWLPIRITRALALHNVRARDEPAMRTLVVGLLLVLCTYALATALVAWFAGAWWALLFLLTLVPSAWIDFRYGDRLRRARARARAYMRFRRDPSLQAALLQEAEWLRDEAGALERLAIGS